MNEFNKMIENKIYDPSDKYLSNLRSKAHKLCLDYNSLYEDNIRRNEILKELGIINYNTLESIPNFFPSSLKSKYKVYERARPPPAESPNI